MPNQYVNKVNLADGTSIIDISDTTATADKILQGYGAYGADGAWMDGTAVAGSGSAVTVVDTPDSHGGTIRTITAVSLAGDTVSAAHLESGYTAHDALGNAITGTLSPGGGGTVNLQTKTNIDPTENSQTITADTGYDGLESVQINGIPGSYVGSGVTRRSGTDLSASGATVTVPAGYYASAASKSVASGSAGTPSASKGTVSGHAVTVTPSVTNSAGYISGGTKTGTGVTVSASELVSGNKEITANGTNIDVATYSTVSVAVPSGTSKNTQVMQSTSRTTATSLTKVLGDMTVSKTGTYDVYWSGARTNTSSSYTWGTRLYIDGTGYGTENTTWSNNVQSNHLSNVSLTANQKLSVYARGRGGSYYACVPMLTIIEA